MKYRRKLVEPAIDAWHYADGDTPLPDRLKCHFADGTLTQHCAGTPNAFLRLRMSDSLSVFVERGSWVVYDRSCGVFHVYTDELFRDTYEPVQ